MELLFNTNNTYCTTLFWILLLSHLFLTLSNMSLVTIRYYYYSDYDDDDDDYYTMKSERRGNGVIPSKDYI